MDAGHDLHTVYTARLRSDYNLALIITPEIAAGCLQKAHSFIAVCAARFGFARP